INKDENHILGPSTIAIAKKFKELIQKDELSIADLTGAGLERLKVQYNNGVELEYHVSQLKAFVISEAQWNNNEGDVSKPRSFERQMSKSTKLHPCCYNNDYTYLVDLSTKEKYTTSIAKHYAARYYKEDLRIKSVVRIDVKNKWGYGFLTSIVVRRSDDKEYEFNYADLPRLSVNDNEDIYLLQVQDKLHHLLLEFVKDFNNALLMFIRRTLSEVKKFSDGTLVKIQENLIDMLSKNKLGSGNKRLKGRDWTNYDVKSSREMLKKIDEVLRHRDQLRRLEEYVGGRLKTINPRTFDSKPLAVLAFAATYPFLPSLDMHKRISEHVTSRILPRDGKMGEWCEELEKAQSAYPTKAKKGM
nr:hypothetical protein [Tanacetum cinerariifolium]